LRRSKRRGASRRAGKEQAGYVSPGKKNASFSLAAMSEVGRGSLFVVGAWGRRGVFCESGGGRRVTKPILKREILLQARGKGVKRQSLSGKEGRRRGKRGPIFFGSGLRRRGGGTLFIVGTIRVLLRFKRRIDPPQEKAGAFFLIQFREGNFSTPFGRVEIGNGKGRRKEVVVNRKEKSRPWAGCEKRQAHAEGNLNGSYCDRRGGGSMSPGRRGRNFLRAADEPTIVRVRERERGRGQGSLRTHGKRRKRLTTVSMQEKCLLSKKKDSKN